MKILTFVVLALPLIAWGQAPAADKVVARIGGKPVTAAEVTGILNASPSEAQKNYLKDPKAFLQQLAMMQELAAMAEKAHLDQQGPTKDALDKLQTQYVLSRRQTLANAQIQTTREAISVSAEDQKKFYETNRDRYTQARIKMLFISFRSSPGPQTDPKAKKSLTEPEAKAKAEKLLADVRAGADFVKLVKANSEDQESAARDGDFGKPISRSDQFPADIMLTIFTLKPGQVSEPVRVNTGYYLFRLEDLSTQSYEQVRDNIFTELQTMRFNEWLTKLQSSIEVKVENEEFFTNQAAGK